MKKQLYHFEILTREEEERLKHFESLTDSEFQEILTAAENLFSSLDVLYENWQPVYFKNECSFISSSDALNGFYFPCARIRSVKVPPYRLLCIAFKIERHFDFEKHLRFPDTLQPVAIFEDESENRYFVKQDEIPRAGLVKFQDDLRKEIEHYISCVEAWEKVERVRKKSGENFARIEKNFINAKIEKRFTYYVSTVCGRTTKNIWFDDDIYFGEDLPTPEQIEKAICNRIEELKEILEYKKRLLDLSEEIYIDTMESLVEIINKYGTPTNKHAFAVKYFKYTVEEWLKNI